MSHVTATSAPMACQKSPSARRNGSGGFFAVDSARKLKPIGAVVGRRGALANFVLL